MKLFICENCKFLCGIDEKVIQKSCIIRKNKDCNKFLFFISFEEIEKLGNNLGKGKLQINKNLLKYYFFYIDKEIFNFVGYGQQNNYNENIMGNIIFGSNLDDLGIFKKIEKKEETIKIGFNKIQIQPNIKLYANSKVILIFKNITNEYIVNGKKILINPFTVVD